MTYCATCDRIFRSWDAYFQHMENSSYHNYCRRCDEDFDSWTGLRQHWIQSSNHAFCRQCDTHFVNEVTLLEHCINQHSYCSGCDRFFRNDQGLHEHNRQVHHYCVECRRVFNSESNLRSHLNSSVHRPKNVPCQFQHLGCIKYFVSASAMFLHLETGTCVSGVDRRTVDRIARQVDRHNLFTVPQRLLTNGGGTTHPIATQRSWNGHAYECVLCHRTFHALDALNRHLASPTHEERTYRCPHNTCLKTFTTVSALCQHIESERCGVLRFMQEPMNRLLKGLNRLSIQG